MQRWRGKAWEISALGNPTLLLSTWIDRRGVGLKEWIALYFVYLFLNLNNEQQVFSMENACDRHFKRRS